MMAVETLGLTDCRPCGQGRGSCRHPPLEIPAAAPKTKRARAGARALEFVHSGQSRRDCITQPRVARHEATLGECAERTTNPVRVSSPPRLVHSRRHAVGFSTVRRMDDATLTMPPQINAHPNCSQS